MADKMTEEMALVEALATTAGDVEMVEGEAAEEEATSHANGSELPFAETGLEELPPPRTSFLQYLASPIVTLPIGVGDNETILIAHQGLLTQSTFFAEACAEFANDGSV